jgi:cytochrome P450
MTVDQSTGNQSTGNESPVFDGYDLYEGPYAADPHPMWRQMREAGCPVAHSDRYGGSWLPVRYADMRDIARNPGQFSSRAIEAGGQVPPVGGGLPTPPVTSDPPRHKADRDVVLPFFKPARVAAWEPFVRQIARERIAELRRAGGGDAVDRYAKHLPMAVLTKILGVPIEDAPRFVDWTTGIIRLGPRDQARRTAVIKDIMGYLGTHYDDRLANPSSDLISHMAHAELNGARVSRTYALGVLFLVAIAGADTTWSTIGAAIWHLGSNPADRDRLVAEPALIPAAVEELLRVYAPATMARITSCPVTLGGREIAEGERVLLPYPAANRDPEFFDDPDTFLVDRTRNRHLAFGTGAHRCLGAGLARLELTVTVEEWLSAMPGFRVPDPAATMWTPGAVRGPESVVFESGAFESGADAA